MSDRPIVILGGRKKSTNIVYHGLGGAFPIECVILEDPVPRSRFLRRRAKNLGLPAVVGQVLFQAMVLPWLKRGARRRIAGIMDGHGLDDSPIDRERVVDVESANAEEVIELLKKIDPPVVVINGTRIISKKVLTCTSAKFVNMHAGITPLYRGVHGAYWALTENNRGACGVTVHFVDPGIDTGSILEQALIEPTEEDNFATYPLLQIAAGLPLLKKAVGDVIAGTAETRPPPAGPSKLWSHPTLFQYLRYRIRHGVK